MALFTISDLHLPLGVNKPMDVFGPSWDNYVERLYKNWSAAVGKDDTVVMPGDFSWAMALEETKKDFEFLSSLPGRKILLKGNHDFWWATVTKVKKYLKENNFADIELLQNNSFLADGTAVCGTRFWTSPELAKTNGDDLKIYERELMRAELSILDALKQNPQRIVFFCHYPPIFNGKKDERLYEILTKYGINKVYYGHIHTGSVRGENTQKFGKIEYSLVSCNCIDFTPMRVY